MSGVQISALLCVLTVYLFLLASSESQLSPWPYIENTCCEDHDLRVCLLFWPHFHTLSILFAARAFGKIENGQICSWVGALKVAAGRSNGSGRNKLGNPPLLPGARASGHANQSAAGIELWPLLIELSSLGAPSGAYRSRAPTSAGQFAGRSIDRSILGRRGNPSQALERGTCN